VAGYPIRLCGQDSRRGTFSHRHAVLHDQLTGEQFTPLTHLGDKQAKFSVIDSVLSEEGVMGFEYGFATTDPESLVIWEAQYGDFFNGAQVVVDQFLSSGEQKWGRLCGLMLFLPHGYEGAGPEHSSARVERFLQLAAQDNMQVCIPSTPAQHFHMIRRQMLRTYRKPLIVFTPKSTLRMKASFSDASAFTSGEFQPVIPDHTQSKSTNVRKLIFCSGKIYYDLVNRREEKKLTDIAIIRIEQLYPFPKQQLNALLKQYAATNTIVWAQEEPKNQGAWYFIMSHLSACLQPGQVLTYAGRPASASPATGYAGLHNKQRDELLEAAVN